MSLYVPDTERAHQRTCQEYVLLDLVELQVADGVLGALLAEVELDLQLLALASGVEVDEFQELPAPSDDVPAIWVDVHGTDWLLHVEREIPH